MAEQARKLLIPVLIQETAALSGRSVLQAILEGYKLAATDEIWAEAQFDGDDVTVESVVAAARTAGLAAAQINLSAEQLLASQPDYTPFIAYWQPRGEPGRYIAIWNQYGSFFQILDPVHGRRVVRRRQLQRELVTRQLRRTAADYLSWVTSPAQQQFWQRWLDNLSVPQRISQSLLQQVNAGTTWQEAAAFEAALRFVQSLVEARGLNRGPDATAALQKLLVSEDAAREVIPAAYWTVQLAPGEDAGAAEEEAAAVELLWQVVSVAYIEGRIAALAEPPPHPPDTTFWSRMQSRVEAPEIALWQVLTADGAITIWTIIGALALVGTGLTIETFLLQGLINVGQELNIVGQRITVIGAVLAFFVGLLILQLPVEAMGQQLGRRVEARFRIAFLEKLPRLGQSFFQRFRISDITQVAYSLRSLHNIPDLALKFLQISFQMLLTAVGLIWLQPSGAPLIIASVAFVIWWAYLVRPILDRQSFNMSSRGQLLNRIYLDTLIGIVTVRVHSAERAVRRQHETAIVRWARVALDYFNFATLIQTIGPLINTLLTIALLFNYVRQGGKTESVLLLVYWAVSMPVLGLQVVQSLQDYLQKRAIVTQLLRPLSAPDDVDIRLPDQQLPEGANPAAVRVDMEDVSVRINGQTLIENINLTFEPGDHLVIVGSSGAGKSTLVSLLLGWHVPASGRVLIDGRALEGQTLEQLRRETAWVDPAVQIWNRTLLYNLRYASQDEPNAPLGHVIEEADLFDVLNTVPDGLQTVLGEGGSLLSGGQGQRVRLARAMLQTEVRLVILDEPFRGLDREKRRILLARARRFWAEATLICITHDVGEAQGFERVLVMENGRIIEDDDPKELVQTASRYKVLLDAEEDVRRNLWASAEWRRLWLEEGKLGSPPQPISEEPPAAADEANSEA